MGNIPSNEKPEVKLDNKSEVKIDDKSEEILEETYDVKSNKEIINNIIKDNNEIIKEKDLKKYLKYKEKYFKLKNQIN